MWTAYEYLRWQKKKVWGGGEIDEVRTVLYSVICYSLRDVRVLCVNERSVAAVFFFFFFFFFVSFCFFSAHCVRMYLLSYVIGDCGIGSRREVSSITIPKTKDILSKESVSRTQKSE